MEYIPDKELKKIFTLREYGTSYPDLIDLKFHKWVRLGENDWPHIYNFGSALSEFNDSIFIIKTDCDEIAKIGQYNADVDVRYYTNPREEHTWIDPIGKSDYELYLVVRDVKYDQTNRHGYRDLRLVSLYVRHLFYDQEYWRNNTSQLFSDPNILDGAPFVRHITNYYYGDFGERCGHGIINDFTWDETAWFNEIKNEKTDERSYTVVSTVYEWDLEDLKSYKMPSGIEYKDLVGAYFPIKTNTVTIKK